MFKKDSQLKTKIKNNASLKIIGFIVNPIAGMGGAVGLKGTDGKEILEKAIKLGAQPIAHSRAKSFLLELYPIKKYISFLVGSGIMGEKEVKKHNFNYKIISKISNETTKEDTKKIVNEIFKVGAELLVFCGGDGTARDILTEIDKKIPVLGVPTGVKMHSALFAVDPKSAARVVKRFLIEGLPLKETEVMDVNEKAYREGRLSAELYGYVLSPYEPQLIQGMKISTRTTDNELRNQAAIAVHIIENMEPDIIYIIGPGTTTRTIADLINSKKTLLGVDLYCNKKIIGKDLNEKEILSKIKGKKAKIIVTPIGGQGFIFGRGNQQISSKVIFEVGLKNIIIIATMEKLKTLKNLRIDTGSLSLDKKFQGKYLKIITDYKTEYTILIQ